MTLERSWTTDMNIVGRREPLGLAAFGLVPVSPWTAAAVIAAVLGYSAYQSAFGTSQSTFDAGWADSATFDQRMAAMKLLWLKFDQTIQLKCPAFVKKDGGKWWKQWKSDLNGFGKFYNTAGTHSALLTGAPTPVQIAGAEAQLESLISWGKLVEGSCPGTFPGLGGPLAASAAEQVAAEKAVEDAGKSNDLLSNLGSNFGKLLGYGAIGLLGFFWLAGKVERGFQGLEGPIRLKRGRYGRHANGLLRTKKQYLAILRKNAAIARKNDADADKFDRRYNS